VGSTGILSFLFESHQKSRFANACHFGNDEEIAIKLIIENEFADEESKTNN